jgi:hypothetical protein
LKGNQSVKIVQWNRRSLRSKLPKFQQRSQNIDAIILSETWLDEAESVYLNSFDVVRKESIERADGGVAIFINNKLKYSHKDCMMMMAKLKCYLNYIQAKIKY